MKRNPKKAPWRLSNLEWGLCLQSPLGGKFVGAEPILGSAAQGPKHLSFIEPWKPPDVISIAP